MLGGWRAGFLGSAVPVARTLLSMAALNALPLSAVCAADDGKKDDSDIVKMMAEKAKRAMGGFTPDGALDIDPKRMYDVASKHVYQLVNEGAAGQVGFGFMMGYSSGYFLKKVSRGVALLAGGIFCVIQALSYHGYMNVNYDRLKSDVENIFDLNKDGKIDSEDAGSALNKISEVLGYTMPAGGGFSVGIVMGLRA